MNSTMEPKLAPPGAGLPPVEHFVARLIMGYRCRTGNREIFKNRFIQERTSIAQIIKTVDQDAAGRRVLIKRCAGLEDSSRNWSIWMTLDHLRIVNIHISEVIDSLAKGVVPPGQASTAAVKPDPQVKGAVLFEYEKSCDTFLNTTEAIHDLKTSKRYAHPWFGPLDAFGWFSMAGGHLAIHRTQIERIVRGLNDHAQR